MAAFALTQALPVIRRSQYFNEAPSWMEQLVGIVDGTRRTFRTANKPLVVDTAGLWGPVAALTVYDAAENVVSPALYSVASYAEGAIQFVHAPTMTGTPSPPFYASYTWADLDLPTLYGAILNGFYEMETRFYRGFTLAPQSLTTTPVTGQVDVAVIDPATGGDPAGPNGSTFSTSIVQLNFLAMCTVYRLARDYMFAMSKSAYRYREGRQGMEIDPTSALKAQKDHLTEISARMAIDLQQARDEWDGANSGLGSMILNPQSSGYNTAFNWQQYTSSAGNYGGFVGP